MLFKKQKNRFSSYSLVIIAMVIFGTNAVALKFATNTMEPLVFAGLRALLVGTILMFFVSNYKVIFSKRVLLRLLPSVLLLMMFLSLHAIGVSQSGALKASILSLTIPVFVYIFAITLLHEPLIKRIFFGGVVTLLGSLLLIGIPVILGKPLVFSDVLLLLAYACVAGVIIHSKYLFKWLTTNELLSIRFLLVGILLVAFVLVFMKPSAFMTGDAGAWMALLYSIVIVGIAGNTFLYRGLSRLKAEQTAPLFYIDPMTGTLFAALLLGETLELTTLLGVIVIIIGVAIAFPHHHHLMHNYLHPKSHRLKRTLQKLLQPIKH